MFRKTLLIALTTLCGFAMAPLASAFPVEPNQDLNAGGSLYADGTFSEFQSHNIFGIMFTIFEDVNVGSGYALSIDTFGSHAAGTDTELALYSADGTHLYSINDDYDMMNYGDSYLGFGDASQPSAPFNGDTTGNTPFNGNTLNLQAGTYVVVVGAFNCVWNTDQMQNTAEPVSISEGSWYFNAQLTEVPAPSTLSLLCFGSLGLAGGQRRRRRRN